MDPGGPKTYGSGTLIEVKIFQNYTGQIRNPLRKNYSRSGTTTLLTRAMSQALQANSTNGTVLCNVKTWKNFSIFSEIVDPGGTLSSGGWKDVERTECLSSVAADSLSPSTSSISHSPSQLLPSTRQWKPAVRHSCFFNYLHGSYPQCVLEITLCSHWGPSLTIAIAGSLECLIRNSWS